MKVLPVSLALAVALSSGCSRSSERSSLTRDTEALAGLVRAHVAAVNAREPERVSAGFAEDAVYLAPDQREIVGNQALASFLRTAYAQGAAKAPAIQMISTELKVSGDWAIEWGRVEAVPRPSGGASVWIGGKYLHTYQRQADRSWRIAKAMYNSGEPRSDHFILTRK